MSTESYFRAMLGMVVFLTVLVTGIHRYKAAQSGEQISRKVEGYLFAVVLRMAGLWLFVTTFTYLIVPASVQWAMIEIPIPVRWIGAIAGLFSYLLMYWTLSSLGRNLTDTVVTRVGASLVTHGPYRWVRHRLKSKLVSDIRANHLSRKCSLALIYCTTSTTRKIVNTCLLSNGLKVFRRKKQNSAATRRCLPRNKLRHRLPTSPSHLNSWNPNSKLIFRNYCPLHESRHGPRDSGRLTN